MTDTTTTTKPASTKRTPKSIILADRHCQRRVAARTKVYDRKCPGLYVSITAARVASFNFRFTCPQTGKQRSTTLGIYSPEFTVADARAKVYALKAMEPAALVAQLNGRKAEQARQGKTVAELIDERIEWIKTPVRKKDGGVRPREESWETNTARHLNRFVRPRLGRKLASEVVRADIVCLSDDIVAGKFGKPSVANARHMRKAAKAMFGWAAERGFISASPCVHLGRLDREFPRSRVLSEQEIRTLWHGLDRADVAASSRSSRHRSRHRGSDTARASAKPG